MNQLQAVSTITSKGQITIPTDIRKYLGVDKSDKVAFVVESQGQVVMAAHKYPNIESLRGAAGSLPKPLPFKKIRQIAYEGRFKTTQVK